MIAVFGKEVPVRYGIKIVSGFAALWGAWFILGTGLSPWMIVLPFVVSAGFVVWSGRIPKASQGLAALDGQRVGRAVMLWTVIEGLMIVAAVVGLIKLGVPHTIAPAVTIIVGLHWIALARAIPFPIYYTAGGGLILLGVVALFLDWPLMFIVATVGSAIVLWAVVALLCVLLARQVRSPG